MIMLDTSNPYPAGLVLVPGQVEVQRILPSGVETREQVVFFMPQLVPNNGIAT